MRFDQFYTKPETVRACLAAINERYDLEQFGTVVEPSAGTGEFSRMLPGCVSLDVEPRFDGCLLADFLTWERELDGPVLYVGNPPFGRNSSLAVRFFNRAARNAQVIAFVLPRTFRKPSIINRLDRRFHLKLELVLPVDSFYTDEGERSVPCTFQVWELGKTLRERADDTVSVTWDWCEQHEAEWAIRRVGAAAGKLFEPLASSPNSHYYMRNCRAGFVGTMRKCWEHEWAADVSSPKFDVAGNPSLSKQDVARSYARESICTVTELPASGIEAAHCSCNECLPCRS